MNKERLQEIKDSIKAQYDIIASDEKRFANAKFLTDEEQELVDYITSLEQKLKDYKQENEKLNNMLNNADNKNLSLIEEINDKQDIIDKVIEYIKFEWEEIVEDECYENHLWSVDGLVIKKILNILQNGSDSQR